MAFQHQYFPWAQLTYCLVDDLSSSLSHYWWHARLWSTTTLIADLRSRYDTNGAHTLPWSVDNRPGMVLLQKTIFTPRKALLFHGMILMVATYAVSQVTVARALQQYVCRPRGSVIIIPKAEYIWIIANMSCSDSQLWSRLGSPCNNFAKTFLCYTLQKAEKNAL